MFQNIINILLITVLVFDIIWYLCNREKLKMFKMFGKDYLTLKKRNDHRKLQAQGYYRKRRDANNEARLHSD